MSFRYIGSKARLIEQIKSKIGPPTGGFFVDAFCGTGAVAEAAAELGWPIRLNDNMVSATTLSIARLFSRHEIAFTNLGGYQKAADILNSLKPTKGFIWRSYSPASLKFEGIERRYFTEENAGRIDSMRLLISDWIANGLITRQEEQLLIADLLGAINRVANIAGTYGCFLAKWTSQASSILTVKPRALKEAQVKKEVSVGDVFDVPTDLLDTVYLDPPYTKRQYASYYHIIETVTIGDEPIIEGVSGLRPWKDRASDFCYKTRALRSLTNLIRKINSCRILLSYSSEGHISIDDLHLELARIGKLETFPLGSIGRYRPNKMASENASNVKEYLISIDRSKSQLLKQTALEELVV